MDTENDVPSGADDASLVAKTKEVVGWATGDREVEAEGRAEAEEEPVDEAEEAVRKDHGDISDS